MKIEDLIQLLTNRLREFKLSRDYAVMNGDLERVVAADKEILALEDTLFKLNLLVDASKSAEVKEATLAEVVADGSVAVLGEYDITVYATDPLHEQKIMTILSNMGPMDTVEQIDSYIKGKYPSSPVTGDMVMNASKAYAVDARLMMAIMELDSRFGTVGVGVATLNPGNVGNDDDGNTRTYDSWQAGVTAVAEWLHRHRSATGTPGVLPDLEPEVTPEQVATSTPSTATSTPSTSTSTPQYPTVTFPTSTTTPSVATSSPPASISTTTPEIALPPASTATTTEDVLEPDLDLSAIDELDEVLSAPQTASTTGL